MKEKLKKWKDFENKSIILIINQKEFFGTFYIKENKLLLKITMTNDINEWRKTNNDIPLIQAILIENNQKISLLNCIYYGHSSAGYDPIIYATVTFFVDRILIGYELLDCDQKFIQGIGVQFHDISWITRTKIYKNKNNILEKSINISTLYKEYKLNDKCIIFNMLPRINYNDLNITIMSSNYFIFNFSSNQSIYEAIRYAYMFKNLLMLFGKRNIIITDFKIYGSTHSYQLLGCEMDKDSIIENNELIQYLNNRNGFQIEKIKNFEEIITNFENLYDELTPLIELYYNVVKCKVSNLTRLINSFTMLEFYSRKFDDINALNLTIKEKGKKNKNGAEFIYRVISLIQNVNCIFNISNNDIKLIAKKIKNARTYYIHYDNNGEEIDNDKLFKYVYFIEDVIILNIYLLLNIDIKNIENVSFNGYFYKIKDLI